MTSSRSFRVVETREVMEVTAGNLDEVAAWCEGERMHYTDNGRGSVFYAFRAGERMHGEVLVGDVLVTDGQRWWDVSREEFDRLVEHWEETTP